MQKRQRRDVAGNEASEIGRVNAAERPHREVRAREEEQRGRDRKRREHNGATRASPPAENGRSRQSGIDDGHDAPVRATQHEIVDEHRRNGHGQRRDPAAQNRAGEQRTRRNGREVRRVRQQTRDNVEPHETYRNPEFSERQITNA